MSATALRPSLAAVPGRSAVMARAGHENFPVASRLLGARERSHLLAIYGFARLADEIGDEAEGDRTVLLDWLDSELDRVYAGREPEHDVMRALVPTVRACAIPAGPFRRLVLANRRDQAVTRYRTFDELLGYCQLSAAPVGELVLYVFGRATADRVALSDRICAGLQLTEHLQDVAEDLRRGRVYLPGEDLAHFGCADEDLWADAASQAFTELMAFEVGRARRLLTEGAPLVRRLPVRPALAVAGFVAGGRAALEALVRGGYDVLGDRPRPTRVGFVRALTRTLRGRTR